MNLIRRPLTAALLVAIDMMIAQEIVKKHQAKPVDLLPEQRPIAMHPALGAGYEPRVTLSPEHEPDPYKTIADGLSAISATIDAGGA